MIKETYLKQAKTVCWKNEFSESFKVDRGVRQGSPLSPFLFALVMDEVIEVINSLHEGCEIKGTKINIIVYADDIVVLGPTKRAIENLLKVLVQELRTRGLEVNKNKTVAICFSRCKKRVENSAIIVEGREIKWVSQVKYLGVTLQFDFKWETQLKENVNKMNRMGNMILHQVGGFVNEQDKVYLLQCCAFDLSGFEFCKNIAKKNWEAAAKMYHWLIKRSIGKSKYHGNHEACVESGLLTWDLMHAWKQIILWENICKNENSLLKLFFGDSKWDSDLGKSAFKTLMDFGRETRGVKEIKVNMLMHIEAMAVLKDMERGDCL